MEKIKWKIYFILIFMLSFLSILDQNISEIKIYEFIDILISLVGIIGLFGFVFSHPILFQTFWKLVFIIFLFWDIIISMLYFDEIFNESGFLLKIFFFILIVPEYVALYLYGYKSKEIWDMYKN